MPLRLPALVAALLGAALPAVLCAQQLVYQGIAWGTPADSLRARLEAAGYAYHGVVGSGDRSFDRADGKHVEARMRADRVVGFLVVEPERGSAVEPRFAVLADSLQAALGTPLDRRPEMRVWEAGLTSVAVLIYHTAAGEREVETEWRGPGWHDEMARRGALLALPPLPAGYTAVSMTPVSRVSVDTATITPAREGSCVPASASTPPSRGCRPVSAMTRSSTPWISTAGVGEPGW